MLAVLACIKDDHNLWLVGLAAIICVTSSLTAMRFQRRVVAAGGTSRILWSCFTGLLAGSGVWATHFVALLAYDYDLPIRYHLGMTGASLVIGVVGIGAGLSLAATAKDWTSRVVGGVIAGLGIIGLHYVGIAAVRSAFHIEWNWTEVFASTLCSVLFSTAAVSANAILRGWKQWAFPAALFVFGVVSLHFTGMTAMVVVPDLTVAAVAEVVSQQTLAIITGSVALLVVATSAIMTFIEARTRESGLRSLNGAFQAVSSGMALFDASDRLVVWNEAYERILEPLGVQPHFGATREMLSLGTAMEARRLEAVNTMRAGKTFSAEWRSPAGVWLRIEMRALPNGGAVTVLSDITDLKNVAVAMAEARDRAEAASQAKSDFLANMSHEIRTPLNGVLGMAQVMAVGELSQPQRQNLEVIQESGGALLAILNDILDLSKVQAGRIELDAAPFNLRDFAEATTAAFSGAAKTKGLTLSMSVDPQCPQRVTGDSLRLRQVMANLIGNAVKFTPVGAVTLAVTCSEKGLALAVRDTGIGMPSEDIPRLFEKFAQADTTATRQYGGTGLGLAICQELVNLMGGTIEVTSEMGVGSCFTVRVPLEAAHSLGAAGELTPIADQGASADAQVQDGQLLILAAEDNPTNQRVLQALLTPLDIELVLAANGREAVEAYRTRRFDLVLMDIQMPEMNGVEAAQAIRQLEVIEDRPRTPILALTANVMPNQIEEYRRAGMDDCVAKPLDMARLFAAIETALTPGGAAAQAA